MNTGVPSEAPSGVGRPPGRGTRASGLVDGVVDGVVARPFDMARLLALVDGVLGEP